MGILALNGAKILEDGGALRVVPLESFRRLATILSPSPFSRPRDMLHLHFLGDMIDCMIDCRKKESFGVSPTTGDNLATSCTLTFLWWGDSYYHSHQIPHSYVARHMSDYYHYVENMSRKCNIIC